MDLEDQILQLLRSASGSLLDDMALIDTLEASKITSRKGAAALQVGRHPCIAQVPGMYVLECPSSARYTP
jgi:ATP-binding dynein motor region